MAYADKITTMQRVALITPHGGHIQYEGVLIEGRFLLNLVDWKVRSAVFVDEEKMDSFLEEHDLILCFQDKKGKVWEPRADSKEYTERSTSS